MDYYIDRELMQFWKHSSEAAWAVMSAMEGDWSGLLALCTDKSKWPPEQTTPLYPYHTFKWFSTWGKTDFAEAFMDYRLHDDLMVQDYINIGDRRL